MSAVATARQIHAATSRLAQPSAFARCETRAQHDPAGFAYTPHVASKKGVIGCESPLHRCDASRSFSPQGNCGFVVRASDFFGGSDGRSARSCRFAQAVPGLSHPFELPPLCESRSGGFCKPHRLEASMARSASGVNGRLVSSFATAPTESTSQLAAPELEIYMDDLGTLRFTGTAAQLISEGLIPEGFSWPKGLDAAHWTLGPLQLHASRVRPTGFKGPARAWWEIDSWGVWIRVSGRVRDPGWYVRRRLERKAAAIKLEIFEHSPEGEHLRRARQQRYYDAKDDRAFQSFKALVPGLTRARRKETVPAVRGAC